MRIYMAWIALLAAGLLVGQQMNVIGLSPGATNGWPTGRVADWILAPEGGNLLLYPEDLTNAAWVLGGTTARTAATLSFPTDGDYISQTISTPINPGDKLVFSGLLSGVAGETVQLLINRAGAGTDEGTATTISLTATPTRYSVARTFLNAQTGVYFRVRRLGTTATSMTATQMELNLGSTNALAYASNWFSPTLQSFRSRVGPLYPLPRGSAAGMDTNDCTITAAGCSFATDDYMANPGAMGVVNSAAFVFYTATEIGPASTAQTLWGGAAVSDTWQGVLALGSSTTTLTNEIITVWSNNGSRVGWCDAAGSIPTGWHIVQAAFDGSGWNIWLDGRQKSVTTAGLDPPSAWSNSAAYRIGGQNNAGVMSNFFNGTIHRAQLANRAWAAPEIRRACQLIAAEAARSPYNIAAPCQ